MEYLIGASLALGVGVFATVVGLDRSRAFYATVLIVVGSYYDLFAVLGGSAQALSLETLVFLGFAAVAVVGFRSNPWLIVAGLVAHGGQDLVHGQLIANPGVPAWWPGFCMAFDVAAGAYLAARLGLAGRGAPATVEAG